MIKATRARMTTGGAARYALPPVAVVIALATTGAAMAWLCYWGRDLHRFIQWVAAYVGLFVGQLAMYAAACYVVMRGGGNRSRAVTFVTLGIILFFAIAFRVTLARERPYLSSDIYRYVWDGRVQANGINPYRYPPNAEELKSLEDEKIFRNINPDDLKWLSPYPPAAQAIFFAVYSLRPSSFIAMKLAMSLFDIITILALMFALARAGIDPARAIILAWHPLPIYEGAHSGHIESAYIAFLALALLSWAHKKHALTGVTLALAALVKFYPALLLPVFLTSEAAPPNSNKLGRAWLLSRIRGLFNRANFSLLAAFAMTITVAYLPYASAGANVFGFVRGYVEEEGFVDKGMRYYLLVFARSFAPLPTSVYLMAALAALVTLAAWWMIREKRDVKDVACGAASLVGLYLILTSPRYSWYYAWLIPYLCFVPRASWLYLASASVLLYLLWYTPLVYPDIPVWLGGVIFFPTIAWLLWERMGKVDKSKTLTR